MENIDFYVDTDPMSCTGYFNENERSEVDADTHFRLMAHDFTVTDTQSTPKYNLVGQPLEDPAGTANIQNYIKCSENMVAKHKTNSKNRFISHPASKKRSLYWYRL